MSDAAHSTNSTAWPDGTPKSSGNAFTSHGYEVGLDMRRDQMRAEASARATRVSDRRIAEGKGNRIAMQRRGEKG